MFEGVADRILQLLKEHHIKQSELARLCNLSANAITNYKKKKRIPETAALFAISKVLNTSMEWILTGEDSEKTKIVTQGELTEEELDILDTYSRLTSTQKEIAHEYMCFQLSREQNLSCSSDSNHDDKRGKLA